MFSLECYVEYYLATVENNFFTYTQPVHTV